MDIVTQNNKAKVTINCASWADMNLLKQEAFKCIDVRNFNFDFSNTAGFINFCMEILIKAETSDSFNNALFRCLKNCLWDGYVSITEQLLQDKPEIIEDYYEIASNCIEVNLRPFFKSLRTEFLRRFQMMTSKNPKQE